MENSILDDKQKIIELDANKMLESLQQLSAQVADVVAELETIKIPASYSKAKNILVVGMGGSTLGAHIIKTLFFEDITVPLEIVNNYHIPAWVTKDTLVLVSSYSGGTEEPLAALMEAKKRGAKLLAIASGGELARLSKRYHFPAVIFSPKHNPCAQPRMGLGYMIVGQIVLLAKAKLLHIKQTAIQSLVRAINTFQNSFGVNNPTQTNIAKQIAVASNKRSVWYVGAEHLQGNIHVAANQTNENGKRFAGSFVIPELNHHLMEGMGKPTENSQNLLFVTFTSQLYDKRIQKRFEITHTILEKNNIQFKKYNCTSKSKIEQVAEILLLSSYASFYMAMIAGINPAAIPYVDFFKAQLKK